MQKNVKTMWFYVVIIVFVAIMLIMVSSVPDVNNNYVSEQNETMGKIDKSLTMLTSQNEELTDKLEKTEKEKNEIKEEFEKTKEYQKNMILAMDNYISENYEESAFYLKQIDENLPEGEFKEIYNRLKQKLLTKGFTLE